MSKPLIVAERPTRGKLAETPGAALLRPSRPTVPVASARSTFTVLTVSVLTVAALTFTALTFTALTVTALTFRVFTVAVSAIRPGVSPRPASCTWTALSLRTTALFRTTVLVARLIFAASRGTGSSTAGPPAAWHPRRSPLTASA
jgi:hypothetical protein